jgi:hypothetical protein
LNGCSEVSKSEALAQTQDALTAGTSVSDGTLACGTATSVSVELTAGNLASVTPVDIMLTIDDSGSINDVEFEAMRDDPEWMAGEERRLKRITPLEESIRLSGVYEVVEEIVPDQ